MGDDKGRDYLANERTFLAWMRTCIAVISLGFVVAKFGLWLRQLAVGINPDVRIHTTGLSLPVGIGMMAMGAVLALMSGWNYHRTAQAIERGEVGPNRSVVAVVSFAVAFLGVATIVYMLVAVNSL